MAISDYNYNTYISIQNTNNSYSETFWNIIITVNQYCM